MSDDYLALLQRGTPRLNAGKPLETPVIVTYSFAERGDFPRLEPAYEPRRYESMSNADRQDVRDAFDEYERRTGLTFVEVPDRGKLDFMVAVGAGGTSWAYYPRDHVQNVVINKDWVRDGLDRGEDGFQILLHEIGHATGLKHPFQGRNKLPERLDNHEHTVMSYQLERHNSGKLGEIDIAALEYYYGGPTGLDVTLDEAHKTARFADGDRSMRLEFKGYALTIIARGGDDTLTGNATSDVLDGGAGNDKIYSDAGSDLAIGRAGDDLIQDRGSGNNTLKGGAGDDTLSTHEGNDLISGGSGDDIIDDRGGNNTLRGGPGDDDVKSGRGDDLLLGGTGHDWLDATRGKDTLEGQRGDDTLIAGGGGPTYIRGGLGADLLIGGPEHDTLLGGTGNDTIRGNAGNSVLVGGDGDDRISSDSWSSAKLFGQSGDDVLDGGRFLWGGSGDDSLDGGADNDVLRGEGGDDWLEGGHDDDFINGGAGADRLFGEAQSIHRWFSMDPGNDTLRGASGDDLLDGGKGEDLLIAGRGDDTLRSGLDDDYRFILSDTLDGGAGNDRLVLDRRGNTDPDKVEIDRGKVVVYGNGYGRDEVVGFTDRDFLDIRVNGTTSDSLTDLARQTAEDVTFNFGHGNSLVLLDVAIGLITDDIFV